jgi:Rad3-related DNA helicase
VQFSRVVISGRSATKDIWEKACEHYDENLEAEELVSVIKWDIDEEIELLEDWDNLEDAELKTLKRLRGLIVRLKNCLMAGDIVTERKEWSIEVVPLKARSVAKKLIFDRADKVLLASATVNPWMIADELDTKKLLGSESLAHFSIPSTFPVERRPIYCMNVCDFKFKNQTLENIMKMEDAIVEIIDRHPDEKGIILLNGYRYAEMLDGAHPRLIFHDKKDRKKKFAEWLGDFSDKVFVGVGFGEGVDLAYDKARFSIIMKNPMPYTKDVRVKARIVRNEWGWLNKMTQSNLLQAAGRIVRAEDDRGEMWILDAAAIKLIKQRGVPSYIREALINVNYEEWKKEEVNVDRDHTADVWRNIGEQKWK